MQFTVMGATERRHYNRSCLVQLISMLTAIHLTQLASGQQVGVSLKLFGVTIPNNSLVDIDDILYRASLNGYGEHPTNDNPELHDQALLCVTDLEDCCNTPHTVRGDWYFPDGNVVPIDSSPWLRTFRQNRGPNEFVNGRQFYGSIRLFRQWSRPEGRGRFRCELPSAADPNTTDILYANIVDFDRYPYPVNITLSSSGPTIVGDTVSMMCSATLVDPVPLPINVPCPTFEWFFGPNGSAPLPSGVTSRANVSRYTFTSILQFPPLNESYTGMYTCRIGAGRLASSIVISIDVGTTQIIPSGAPILGQSYTVTCKVHVIDNLCPLISYQWTKNNGTVTQLEAGIEPNTLTLSPLRLSDAGLYTCLATVRSFRRASHVTVTGTHEIRIQVPSPSLVTLTSGTHNPVRPIGSAVTLTCIVLVELSPVVDVPMTLNTVWTGPDGFRAMNTSYPVVTTHTITSVINSFERNESGIYTCTAYLRSSSTIYYINGSAISDSVQVTTGVYLALRDQFIDTNTQVYIRSIGMSSGDPSNALQCISDKKPCCNNHNPQHGEWYLPSGMLVQGTTSDTSFRGDNGEVYLNRPDNATLSQTGRFCCEVPDATDTNQTLCVIIGRVFITAFGSSIAGESYSLECSTGGTEAEFHWLGSAINDSSVLISSNLSSSQLLFQQLQQSHDGPYSCRAITDEDTLLSEPIEISVKAPSVSAQIINHTRAIAGESYNITCRIFGAGQIKPSITYQWTKNIDGDQIQNLIGSNSSMLSFTPLHLSDAANYSCISIVSSSYLTSNITAIASQNLRIQIPTPSSVTLTSSITNSFLVIGSDVVLSCLVMLNSAILSSEIFLVTVDAQLLRDIDGTQLALTGPTVTGTTFTYTTLLKSLQKSDFGSYTCIVTIRLHRSSTYLTGVDVLSDILNIDAVIPPPADARATQSNFSTPVEISWRPPSDFETFYITGYKIFYDDNETLNNISVPKIITSIGIRVNRSYVNDSVFIRTEADQLHSELIKVPVEARERYCATDMEEQSSYNLLVEIVGTTVGVATMVISIVIAIVIALYWWRKKLSNKHSIAVSANAACADAVSVNPSGIKDDYENLGMVLKSVDDHSTSDRETGADLYETISPSYKKPGVEESEYTSLSWQNCGQQN